MTLVIPRIALVKAASALLVTAFAAAPLAGCEAGGSSGSSSAALECDGNGTMHGDHCHCEPGHMVTADGMGCVAQADAPRISLRKNIERHDPQSTEGLLSAGDYANTV